MNSPSSKDITYTMGTITGWTTAECDTCRCRFNYYLKTPHPFTHSRIVGTCDRCINREEHDCVDECQLGNEGYPKIVGRKKFENKND